MLNVANPAGMYCLGLLSIANKVYLRCFSWDLKTQKHNQSFYVPKLIRVVRTWPARNTRVSSQGFGGIDPT